MYIHVICCCFFIIFFFKSTIFVPFPQLIHQCTNTLKQKHAHSYISSSVFLLFFSFLFSPPPRHLPPTASPASLQPLFHQPIIKKVSLFSWCLANLGRSKFCFSVLFGRTDWNFDDNRLTFQISSEKKPKIKNLMTFIIQLFL